MSKRDVVRKLAFGNYDVQLRMVNLYARVIESLRYPNGRRQDQHLNVKKHKEMYGFVPNVLYRKYMQAFKLALLAIKKDKRRVKFLDAGCGAGNMFIPAAITGFYNVYGIDLDDRSLEMAKHVTNVLRSHHFYIGGCNTIKADLTTFESYRNYDVIYTYQPMKPYSEAMRAFLELLRKSMRVGGVAILDISTAELKLFTEDPKFETLYTMSQGEAVVRKIKK